MIRYIKELLHSLLKILRIFPCKFQGFLYQSNSSTRYDVTQMSSSSTISCWRRHDSCISSAFRKHSTLTRDLPMFRLLNRDRPLFFLLLRLVSFYTNNPIKGRSPKKKTVKKGDIVHTGRGGGSTPVPFLSPNLPDSQITQKWTFDTTI